MHNYKIFSHLFMMAVMLLPLSSLQAQEEEPIVVTYTIEDWHESIAESPESYQRLEASGGIALFHFLMADAEGKLTAEEHQLAESFRQMIFSTAPDERAKTEQLLQPELLSALMTQLPSALFLANQLEIEVHQMALALHSLYLLKAQQQEPINLTNLDWLDKMSAEQDASDNIFAGLLFLIDQISQKKWHYHPYFDQLTGNDLVVTLSVLRAIADVPVEQQENVTRHLFALHSSVDLLWHAIEPLLPFAKELPRTMQKTIADRNINSIYQDVLALLDRWQILHLQSAEELDNSVFGMQVMASMMQLYIWYQPIGEVGQLFAQYLFLNPDYMQQINHILTMDEEALAQTFLGILLSDDSRYELNAEEVRTLKNLIAIIAGTFFGINYAITPDMEERYQQYLTTFEGIRYLALELLTADLHFRHYMQQIQEWYDIHRESYTFDPQ